VTYDVALVVVLPAAVLALGLGTLGLRRQESLVVSRSGLQWRSADWRRRGWLNLAAGVALVVEAAVMTGHSQYLDLLGIAVAIAWLILVLRANR
jgi:hypothetical protein